MANQPADIPMNPPTTISLTKWKSLVPLDGSPSLAVPPG